MRPGGMRADVTGVPAAITAIHASDSTTRRRRGTRRGGSGAGSSSTVRINRARSTLAASGPSITEGHSKTVAADRQVGPRPRRPRRPSHTAIRSVRRPAARRAATRARPSNGESVSAVRGPTNHQVAKSGPGRRSRQAKADRGRTASDRSVTRVLARIARVRTRQAANGDLRTVGADLVRMNLQLRPGPPQRRRRSRAATRSAMRSCAVHSRSPSTADRSRLHPALSAISRSRSRASRNARLGRIASRRRAKIVPSSRRPGLPSRSFRRRGRRNADDARSRRRPEAPPQPPGCPG